MKKRFGALILALILACSLAIPVGAANIEKTPEELYQDYLNAADEINAKYGSNISIVPLEEMDPNDMPTLEEVRADVTELATMVACSTTTSAPDAGTFSARANTGIGNHPVSTTIEKQWASAKLKFVASITVVVNYDSSEGKYGIQYVYNPSVMSTYAPTGYAVTATSNATWIISTSKKSGIVTRPFKVTYGSATTSYKVTASVVLSTASGAVTMTPA